MLKKHTRHFEEEGRAYYISTNQCTKLAIQIQVKHRRKYKSQDHQAGRWQHSCAWQRIIQPWAMITAQLSTVGVISPESFIPGEQLWKLFPYSLKKSFGSDQPVPFLWNCLLSEIIESIADKVMSLFAVGNKIYSCCDAVQLQLNYSIRFGFCFHLLLCPAFDSVCAAFGSK